MRTAAQSISDDKPTALELRLQEYHKRRHSYDPTYMSDSFTEYVILQKKFAWKIQRYHGGYIPHELLGNFNNFRAAEDHLIRFLRKTNKTGYARYPGCPKPRPTNSTELLLKDWSPKPHS